MYISVFINKLNEQSNWLVTWICVNSCFYVFSNSSDSESVSGSESGSDSSKHSLKSDKSTQSEKCISFAKTGIDDSNSDDLDMNEEKISECIGGKCDTDAGDVVKSTICHKDTDSLDIYSGDRKTERKSLLDLKQVSCRKWLL